MKLSAVGPIEEGAKPKCEAGVDPAFVGVESNVSADLVAVGPESWVPGKRICGFGGGGPGLLGAKPK